MAAAARTGSPAARLRSLAQSLERAQKLPRKTVLSAEPMRELLGVSWPVLRGWCNDIAGFEESSAFTRGSNGIEWEFKPLATVRFLIKHFEGVQKRQIDKARETRRLVGGEALEGLPDDFDLDQIAKIIRTTGMLREERERAGQLIDARRAAVALRAMMARMQEAGVKSASAQDPTGQWPADIRESFEDAISNVLVTMARAGEEALRAFDGGPAQSG